MTLKGHAFLLFFGIFLPGKKSAESEDVGGPLKTAMYQTVLRQLVPLVLLPSVATVQTAILALMTNFGTGHALTQK